jgi:ATP-dependent DNA ligase
MDVLSDLEAEKEPDFVSTPWIEGWRCLAVISGRVGLLSRSGKDLAPLLPRLVATLRDLVTRQGIRDRLTVLDIVVPTPVERATSDREVAPIASARPWFVLDVSTLGGSELGGRDLLRRMSALRNLGLTRDSGMLRTLPFERGPARTYFTQFLQGGSAGLLLRRIGAPYSAGACSKDWLLCMQEAEKELLVCGITSRGSLILGEFEDERLVPRGETWPSKLAFDIAVRCQAGEPAFEREELWRSLGVVSWCKPRVWVVVRPDLRSNSGPNGPRWRALRIAFDL